MITLRQSNEFSTWLKRLKDNSAVARIVARIRSLELGNPGDVRSVGGGLMEMRIDYGRGYRVYYVRRGHHFIVLLCGEDKSSQQDIRRAQALAKEF